MYSRRSKRKGEEREADWVAWYAVDLAAGEGTTMVVVGVSGGFCFYPYPDTDPESQWSTHCTGTGTWGVGRGMLAQQGLRQARLTVAGRPGSARRGEQRLRRGCARPTAARTWPKRMAPAAAPHLTSRAASACMHARHGLTGTTDQSDHLFLLFVL